jgi:hypothetical protein
MFAKGIGNHSALDVSQRVSERDVLQSARGH